MSLEVGTLVALSKGIVDTLLGLKSLFPKGSTSSPAIDDAFTELRNDVTAFQARLQGLARQLEECERLTRMIPAWEALANQIPVWNDVPNAAPDEIMRLHVGLRDLLNASVHDHFSGTFFRTQFSSLPNIEPVLQVFRANLKNLDRVISTIPAGNGQVFKSLWPQISSDFNNLRNACYEVKQRAEDIQAGLIQELQDAAAQGTKLTTRI
jgi:hypothetical protein